MITGESKSVLKQASGRVIGGTINGDGSLRLRVTAAGEQTIARGIRKSAQERNLTLPIRNKEVAAALALADVIRPESRQAVRQLHDMGIEVAMLTGAEGIVAKDTPFWAQIFDVQQAMNNEALHKLLHEERRDELPGKPLKWQVALRNLVAQLLSQSAWLVK